MVIYPNSILPTIKIVSVSFKKKKLVSVGILFYIHASDSRYCIGGCASDSRHAWVAHVAEHLLKAPFWTVTHCILQLGC